MTRLEGNKPNVGAIIIGAIIFALIAAGLFFAFRPVPEPTDAGLSNSAQSTGNSASASSDSNATSDENAKGLETILTPLPVATPASTAIAPAANATGNSVAAPMTGDVAVNAATSPTATATPTDLATNTVSP